MKIKVAVGETATSIKVQVEVEVTMRNDVLAGSKRADITTMVMNNIRFQLSDSVAPALRAELNDARVGQ